MTIFFKARAPMRLGLAGGGTDVAPFCDLYGGATLNVTISKYVYTEISASDQAKLKLTDATGTKEYFWDHLYDNPTGLLLLVETKRFVEENFNKGSKLPIDIVIRSECNPGSGLGSSSTTVVSFLKCLTGMLNIEMSKYELAETAYHIEREICKQSGGKQDQYAAAFGGLNYIEYNIDGSVLVNPLILERHIKSEIESRLVLCFSGLSRDSAKIIERQKQHILDDKFALQAMQEVKRAASQMRLSLLKGDFINVDNILRDSWSAKKLTAKEISNTNINNLMKCAFEAGASSGKVSGAGGGGYLFFMSSENHKGNVIGTLSDMGARVEDCIFVDHGAEFWKADYSRI